MPEYSTLTRQRNASHFRNLLAQHLNLQNFVQILFVDESLQEPMLVRNFANFWIDSPSSVLKTIKNDIAQGIHCFLLFCVAKNKENATIFTKSVISNIKSYFKSDIYLICDLCLCNISHDGHCGVISPQKNLIENHQTIEILKKMALEFASAGADCIAPSDMRDGRVFAIRNTLNENGFENIAIISYSTKFASNYYGAFRDIYKSGISKNSPLKDRKTYQIDFRNQNDALLSSVRDEAEGADILMVKPAIRYLDIISQIKASCNLPVCAFHVSSECVSLNLLSQVDYASLPDLFLEDWHAIKRSGANFIICYNARMFKAWA